MYTTQDIPTYADDQITASSTGGYLSGFILPPLAVVIIGTLLAIVLLNAGPASPTPVRAASFSQSSQGDSLAPVESTLPPPSIPETAGDISPIFMPEVRYWGGEIKAWAAAAGLDPNLVATVMQIESCGYEKATSRSGAIGLFQVMPYHFTSTDHPYDPDTNALRGLDYLKRSMKAANGDIRLALAGYNGGIGVINRPESSWAGQTQGYVATGSRIYNKAVSSNITSEDIKQWTSSESALCRQAAALEGINP